VRRPGHLTGAVFLLLVTTALPACSSSLTLTTDATRKVVPQGLREGAAVKLGDVRGDPCFRRELTAYLASPGGLELATAERAPTYIVDGDLRRIEVHSNRGDKEVAMLYFSAFVVTAPIAAVMYGAKDWHADAAAEGGLVVRDAGGRTVWQRALTVSIAESQRSMPTADALTSAMTAAVCQKLAATLLNAFGEHLAGRP